MWYANRAPAQVARFIEEFEAVLERIAEFPMASRPLSHGARATHMKVYPHQIWFRIDDAREEVEIVALIHDRQDRSGFVPRLT